MNIQIDKKYHLIKKYHGPFMVPNEFENNFTK